MFGEEGMTFIIAAITKVSVEPIFVSRLGKMAAYVVVGNDELQSFQYGNIYKFVGYWNLIISSR